MGDIQTRDGPLIFGDKMPTIMTALLLGAQIAESGYSHFRS